MHKKKNYHHQLYSTGQHNLNNQNKISYNIGFP